MQATEWPALKPPIEEVVGGAHRDPALSGCGGREVPDLENCSWGSASAETQVVVVGDSVGLSYAGPLREIALDSAGQLRVHAEVMLGCTFVDDLIQRSSLTEECPGRKDHAVEVINALRPDVVIVSNEYDSHRAVGSTRDLTREEYSRTLATQIDKFRPNVGKVVFLSAPPGDVQISDCFGKRSSMPPDCIGKVDNTWLEVAAAEKAVAEEIGGVWVDSRPWFCDLEGSHCPSFVGDTVTKFDPVHMTPEYGRKIAPVIHESLRTAGVF